MSRRRDTDQSEAKGAKPRKRGRPRRELPIVPLKLPRCKICNSTDCPTTRTLDKYEGYLRQERTCANCGNKFEAIWD